VTPGGPVHRRSDEHPGSPARGEPALRVGVDPERGPEKVRHGEIWHEGVFPEALHLEPGKEREKVELLTLQHRDRIRDGGRGIHDVRVGEQDQLPRGPAGALEECVRLAEPALGWIHARNDHQAGMPRGQTGEDLARPVGGAVVHDDHFDARIVLSEMRARGLLDRGGLVARRNHDRDAGPWLRDGALRGTDAPDREEIDEEEDETDGRQRGRCDQGAVDETRSDYDSGTFCRASARYGEFG